MTTSRLSIGAIASAHGVKGQFKVKTFTANPRDIATYGPVYIGGRQIGLVIRGTTANGMVIVAADEVTSREEAEALRGQTLEVDRNALPESDDDEVYHADLIGVQAETEDGTALGRIIAIHDFGGGEIVEVKPASGPTLMLPFAANFVVTIDLEARRAILAPPDGLLDDADVSSDSGEPSNDSGSK